MAKKINYESVKNVNKSVTNRPSQSFDLIVIIIDRGFSDYIIAAARDAGATGGTIILGRGTGIHDNAEILGIKIQPEKEIVMILVKRSKRKETMKKIVDSSNLNEAGRGLCFSLPVNDIAGIRALVPNKK